MTRGSEARAQAIPVPLGPPRGIRTSGHFSGLCGYFHVIETEIVPAGRLRGRFLSCKGALHVPNASFVLDVLPLPQHQARSGLSSKSRPRSLHAVPPPFPRHHPFAASPQRRPPRSAPRGELGKVQAGHVCPRQRRRAGPSGGGPAWERPAWRGRCTGLKVDSYTYMFNIKR